MTLIQMQSNLKKMMRMGNYLVIVMVRKINLKKLTGKEKNLHLETGRQKLKGWVRLMGYLVPRIRKI